MIGADLNGLELQAIRKILMFEVTEAAELIGECTARSWRRWESGKVKPPKDIQSKIFKLIERRNNIKKGIVTRWQWEIKGGLSEGLTLKYYSTFDEHRADFPHENRDRWRLYQSAVMTLLIERDDVRLL